MSETLFRFRWHRIGPALLLLAGLGLGPAPGKDCGRLPKGVNPGVEELDREIAEASARHGVPTEVIKAVAWQESGCQQWRPDGSLVHNAKDCGWGMMQLTGATAAQFDVERLKDDWRYNLDAGVSVLRQKWDRAQREGLVPADPAARRVLEQWYYPIAYYWGGRTEDYLRKIYGHLNQRPGRLQQLLRRGVVLTLPSEVISGFSFGQAFRAEPEGRLLDAQGKAWPAAVHLGTIGDPETLAALDVMLSRGRKAVERKQVRSAVKALGQVVQTDLDTDHKAEAQRLLAPLVAEAEASLSEAERLRGEGDARGARKLLRRLERDWRGYAPLEERIEQALAACVDG